MVLDNVLSFVLVVIVVLVLVLVLMLFALSDGPGSRLGRAENLNAAAALVVAHAPVDYSMFHDCLVT